MTSCEEGRELEKTCCGDNGEYPYITRKRLWREAGKYWKLREHLGMVAKLGSTRPRNGHRSLHKSMIGVRFVADNEGKHVGDTERQFTLGRVPQSGHTREISNL